MRRVTPRLPTRLCLLLGGIGYCDRGGHDAGDLAGPRLSWARLRDRSSDSVPATVPALWAPQAIQQTGRTSTEAAAAAASRPRTAQPSFPPASSTLAAPSCSGPRQPASSTTSGHGSRRRSPPIRASAWCRTDRGAIRRRWAEGWRLRCRLWTPDRGPGGCPPPGPRFELHPSSVTSVRRGRTRAAVWRCRR